MTGPSHRRTREKTAVLLIKRGFVRRIGGVGLLRDVAIGQGPTNSRQALANVSRRGGVLLEQLLGNLALRLDVLIGLPGIAAENEAHQK